MQYPSGAPQVKAAVEEAAWDFGGAGVVPNILGYVTIGYLVCFYVLLDCTTRPVRPGYIWDPFSFVFLFLGYATADRKES